MCQAVVKYRAEASASDKTTYYTQILAQQLSGEQKIEAATLRGVPDMSAQIQLSVALKQMKTAYERPPVSRVAFLAEQF
jgi:N-terminal acetyltransferase B complex non-catalytic subunit